MRSRTQLAGGIDVSRGEMKEVPWLLCFLEEDWSGLVLEESTAASIYICDRGLPRNSLEESI